MQRGHPGELSMINIERKALRLVRGMAALFFREPTNPDKKPEPVC